MKTKLLTFFILFFAWCAKSQTPFYNSFSSTKGFIPIGNSSFSNTNGGFTMAGIIYLDSVGTFGFNLIKLSPEGDVISEKVIKDNVILDLPYEFLRPTNDGGCILATEKKLIKLDSLNNIQWSKKYYSSTSISYGFAVQQTADSGYIVSSELLDTANFNLNNVLLKLDINGIIQWSSKLQFPNITYKTKSTKQTNDGGYMICIIQEYLNTAIVKRNNIGQILWNKNIDNVNIYDMVETSNGDILLAGVKFNTFSFNNDIVLMKMNNLGTILWSKIYRSNTSINAEQIELTNAGDLLISGKASKWTNNIISNVFCLKTNHLGNIIWAKKYGAIDSSSTVTSNLSLANTIGGGAFISYNHINSTDTLFYNLNALKTDSLGNISCSNFQSDLSLINIDTTYLSTNVSFLNSTIQMVTNNNAVADTISPISKLNCSTLSLYENEVLKTIEIFPNPGQGKLSFIIEPSQKNNQIIIFNTLGEKIYMNDIRNYSGIYNLDISAFPNGVYFIKLIAGNKIYSSKIMKQD